MEGVKWSMTLLWSKDDLFYGCSMIEFGARKNA